MDKQVMGLVAFILIYLWSFWCMPWFWGNETDAVKRLKRTLIATGFLHLSAGVGIVLALLFIGAFSK